VFLNGLGIRSLALGLPFFEINLAVCLAGFRTGRFRNFWVTWAIVSVLGWVALGMATPIDALQIFW